MYQKKKTIFELLSSNSDSDSRYTQSQRKNRGDEEEMMTPSRAHQMRSNQSPSPYFERGFAKKIQQQEIHNDFYTQQHFSQYKTPQNGFESYTPQKTIGLKWNQIDQEYYHNMANQHDYHSHSPRSKPFIFENSNTRSQQSFEMQQEQQHFFGRLPEQNRYQEITKQMKQNRYYVPQPSFLTSFHPNQLYPNQKKQEEVDYIPEQKYRLRYNSNYEDQYQDCSPQEMMKRVGGYNRNPFQPVTIPYLQNNENIMMQGTDPYWLNFQQS